MDRQERVWRNFIRRLSLLGVLLASACTPARVETIPSPTPLAAGPVELTALRSETPQPVLSATPHFTPTASPSPKPSPTLTATPEPQVCSPLNGYTYTDLLEIVTNPFAPPAPGKDDGHHGTDFAHYRRGESLTIAGVPVQAALGGIVRAVSPNFIPYGNMVIIETPHHLIPSGLVNLLEIEPSESAYLLYAHMESQPLPALGDTVSCGQILGAVGNTPKGWSSDPHLHLEIRLGPPGTVFEEIMFYDAHGTTLGMDNYRLWRMSGNFRMLDPLTLIQWANGS